MKIKLLACIAFLSLMSCSGGDDSAPVNPENPTTENPNPENPNPQPEDPVVKNLKRISFFHSNSDSPFHVILCDNNKPTELTAYINPGVVYFQQKYWYGENGLLSFVDCTFQDDTTDFFDELEYDENNRLVEKKRTYLEDFGYSIWLNYFTYNNNNTISHVATPGGMYDDLFYLNDASQIYRKDANYDDSFVEVNYDGNNIISMTQNTNYSSYTQNYTYDLETEVKGEFLNLYKNMYGSNSNMILFASDYNYALEFSDNYILTSSDSSISYQYQYEFDSDGYPIVRREYSGNMLNIRVEIEYE